MNIQELLAGIENCECGRNHYCPVDFIKIGSGALNSLPEACRGYSNILLVTDENCYAACGADAESLIKAQIAKTLVLSDSQKVVVPNEERICEIEENLTDKIDLIVGVGSGVINDLCKHVSFKKDLPYFIVATAPSMDGYVSVGSALILGGMKVTLNARPPKAVIADTEVIRNAPIEMIKAGYGDIIGKYSCLNDWKLGNLIYGEYFCRRVYELTYASANRVKELAEGILVRDGETVAALMEALVAVGVAMSYVDCSRPASGSEHHLSHFFEITGILEGKEYFAHGIDVVYSAVVTARVRERILGMEPKRVEFDRVGWEKEIRRIYSSAADGVIALQDKLGWYLRDDSAEILGKWEEIKKVLSEVPTADEFIAMIEKVGLDYSEFEELYGEEKINDAIKYAKDLKDRYSVLWLNDCYFGG